MPNEPYWLDERREFVGVHFRAGDNVFSESKEGNAYFLMKCVIHLFCNKTRDDISLLGPPPRGWEFPQIPHKVSSMCPKIRDNDCIDPANLIIYLATDLSLSSALPLFAPLASLSQRFLALSSFPSLFHPPFPFSVESYSESAGFSGFLHPISEMDSDKKKNEDTKSFVYGAGDVKFASKTCPADPLSLKRLTKAFFPIVDVMIAARGKYFVGTEGSTSSKAAQQTQIETQQRLRFGEN